MTPSSIPGGMDPFRLLPAGFYCDFILLPCSTACMNTTHSPGHKQQQSFPPILPCFRTFLLHLVSCLFTYIWFSVTSVQRCIPSAVQMSSTSSAPFLYNHDPYLWDDNTRLHAYSNFQPLFIFHLQICRTNGDRYGRRRSEDRQTGNIAWEDSGLEIREV